MSDLQKWFAEYVELMYPDDETVADRMIRNGEVAS